MYRIAIALTIATLAGCSTSPQEMRSSGAEKTFTTSKPEKQVAECILYAWQNESLAGAHYNVSLQPKPGGGTSVVSANNREMADVTGGGSMTRVNFYSSSSMGWITDRREASLKPCL